MKDFRSICTLREYPSDGRGVMPKIWETREHMNRYDPLDWVHSWDDFEMVMYAVVDGEDPGIFMQVSRRELAEGAEAWEPLYDRKLTDTFYQTDVEQGSDAWHEIVLRHHLNTHPELVSEEKDYLSQWLREHSE